MLLKRHAKPVARSNWIAWTLCVALLPLVGCAQDDSQARTTIEISGTEATPNAAATRDREVAEIYSVAKTRDVSRLLGLAAQLPVPSAAPSAAPLEPSTSSSPATSASPGPVSSPAASLAPSPTPVPTFDSALALALFYADPKVYADSFVASYPIDADGVLRDYGARWTAARVVSSGALFPIRALSALAAAGDRRALVRLYDALPASQGNIQAAYAREIATIAARDPSRAIRELAAAGPAARLDVLANADWCGRDAARMGVATTASDFEAALSNDLRTTIKAKCSAPRRKPTRRHIARSKHATHAKHATKAKPAKQT